MKAIRRPLMMAGCLAMITAVLGGGSIAMAVCDTVTICDQPFYQATYDCDSALTQCHLNGSSYDYCDGRWQTCYDAANSKWSTCLVTCVWNPPPPPPPGGGTTDPPWGPWTPQNPNDPWGIGSPKIFGQTCGQGIDCGPW